MQTEIQAQKRHFPVVSKKSQGLQSILELIKQKKAQFSKQIDQMQGFQMLLPQITIQRKDNSQSLTPNNQLSQKQISQSQDLKASAYNSSKYKTILDHHSKVEHVFNRNKHKQNSISITKKQNKFQPKERILRTKTQFNPIDHRKISANTRATNAYQQMKEQPKQQNVQQAKEKFYSLISKVPKQMTERSQDNLTQVVVNLQTFNPFFLRNPRIVNICLLKMGRIILRDSPYQLYKAGEQLQRFYIILCGKVKISDGFIKRICQTGETVLQQTLFMEKGKKISLERAKIIGPTYLLEFHIEEYKKLKEQLIRYGLKIAFQQMQIIIKQLDEEQKKDRSLQMNNDFFTQIMNYPLQYQSKSLRNRYQKIQSLY